MTNQQLADELEEAMDDYNRAVTGEERARARERLDQLEAAGIRRARVTTTGHASSCSKSESVPGPMQLHSASDGSSQKQLGVPHTGQGGEHFQSS